MVFSLAKETGWSEHFILWELPFARALEYYHAALWSNGAWTVKPTKTAHCQFRELLAIVDNFSEEDG